MPVAGTIDLTKTILNNYVVSWGASGSQYSFGAVDKVTLQLPLKTKPIKVGSMGDIELGQRVIGIADGAKVQIEARQIDLTFLQKMHPWWSSGSIAKTPAAAQVDLYTYAQLLTLHPNDVAAGTFTQDVNLLKAVPMLSDEGRDGVGDGKDLVDFWIFPDRASFPTIVYGYYGTPP
jgi:hypothetical protein